MRAAPRQSPRSAQRRAPMPRRASTALGVHGQPASRARPMRSRSRRRCAPPAPISPAPRPASAWLDRIETALTGNQLRRRGSPASSTPRTTLAADPTATAPRAAMLESAPASPAPFSRDRQRARSASPPISTPPPMQATAAAQRASARALAKVNDGLAPRRRPTSAAAASLADQRDQLLEQMSALTDVTVTTDPIGRATVRLGGAAGPVLRLGRRSWRGHLCPQRRRRRSRSRCSAAAQHIGGVAERRRARRDRRRRRSASPTRAHSWTRIATDFADRRQRRPGQRRDLDRHTPAQPMFADRRGIADRDHPGARPIRAASPPRAIGGGTARRHQSRRPSLRLRSDGEVRDAHDRAGRRAMPPRIDAAQAGRRRAERDPRQRGRPRATRCPGSISTARRSTCSASSRPIRRRPRHPGRARHRSRSIVGDPLMTPFRPAASTTARPRAMAALAAQRRPAQTQISTGQKLLAALRRQRRLSAAPGARPRRRRTTAPIPATSRSPRRCSQQSDSALTAIDRPAPAARTELATQRRQRHADRRPTARRSATASPASSSELAGLANTTDSRGQPLFGGADGGGGAVRQPDGSYRASPTVPAVGDPGRRRPVHPGERHRGARARRSAAARMRSR